VVDKDDHRSQGSRSGYGWSRRRGSTCSRRAISGREYLEEDSYDRLHEIRAPTLIANGNNDVLIPTHNSYVTWQKLVNSAASLHLYPDSGHGFLDDYTEYFSGLINSFLNN
jgi:pimeloyl-ACP methyl ester carboxylesterase